MRSSRATLKKRRYVQSMGHNFQRYGTANPCWAINLDRRGDPKQITVPITGVPRGGTTMVAVVVESLGVNLGPHDEIQRFHHEDQTMHSPDWPTRYRYAVHRNERCDKWGWKDPTGTSSILQMMYMLRNPHVIVVFRDVLAIVQGEIRFDETYKIPPRKMQALFADTMRWLSANVEMVTSSSVPLLMVSYERAMVEPAKFVDEVCKFLQLTTTPEQRSEALSRVSYSGYLSPESESGTGDDDAS